MYRKTIGTNFCDLLTRTLPLLETPYAELPKCRSRQLLGNNGVKTKGVITTVGGPDPKHTGGVGGGLGGQVGGGGGRRTARRRRRHGQ